MEWIYYTINTESDSEDLVSSVLFDFGITNIEIIDKVEVEDLSQGQVFQELLPDNIEEDDGKAKVRFYVDSDMSETERGKLITEIKEELDSYNIAYTIDGDDLGSGVTRDVDWRDKWKEFFHEFTVGSFKVMPAWEKQGKIGDRVLLVDPGVAFGTGKHESTMLCIEGLEKYMKEGDRVCDIGCGSGILSVVAKKLKASFVSGTDIMEEAIESTEANFKLNEVEYPKDEFFVGDIAKDEALLNRLGKESYDVICANLLADIIESMIPEMYSLLKKGGYVITSGIIDFRAEGLKRDLEKAGFSVVSEEHLGEWVSIVLTK
jgi:ribosomal protein L11 methyltransferase